MLISLDGNESGAIPQTTDALTDHDGKAWRYESEGPALSAPRASRTWGRVVRGKILSAFVCSPVSHWLG